MPSILEKVTRKFADFTEVSFFTPPNTNINTEKIILINYAAETARKSAIYDRVAALTNESLIKEGDVVVIGEHQYIVASISDNTSYGTTFEKVASFINVYDSVTISRINTDNSGPGNTLVSSETVIYKDVPVGLRKIEYDVVKKLQTIREINQVFIPKGLDIKIKDIIHIPALQSEFTVEAIIPFAFGIHTVEVIERRI